MGTKPSDLWELLGPASVLATLIVGGLAWAVHRVPQTQREGLVLILPYCLVLWIYCPAVLDVSGQLQGAASCIYLASAFGFAIYNFRCPHPAFYYNGVASSLVTGSLLAYLGGLLVYPFNPTGTDDRISLGVLYCLFLMAWGVGCHSALLLRCKHFESQPYDSTEMADLQRKQGYRER
jgi:hypothetical protein